MDLTAVAKDAFGNATTSAAVAVTVNNAAGPPAVTLAQLQTDIFTPRCASCHTGTGGGLPGAMNLTSATESFNALVNVTSIQEPTFKRVLPGNPTTATSSTSSKARRSLATGCRSADRSSTRRRSTR